MTANLTLLGHSVKGSIEATQIETIPVTSTVQEVTIKTNELSALCPVTSQPDIYAATISYKPNGLALESKALKMYLVGFRPLGIFAEDLAPKIAQELSSVVHVPVRVHLAQQVRGGLVLEVEAYAE